MADLEPTGTSWDRLPLVCHWQWESALVTINIAIARSVASALIRGSTVLVRYGAQHAGPRGAAARAAPAGGG